MGFGDRDEAAEGSSSRGPKDRCSPPDPALPRTPAPPDAGPATPPVIRSIDLLQGRGEVHILHNGETYRLSLTRAGKLILHK
jgi:hemin uptake protein HemP